MSVYSILNSSNPHKFNYLYPSKYRNFTQCLQYSPNYYTRAIAYIKDKYRDEKEYFIIFKISNTELTIFVHKHLYAMIRGECSLKIWITIANKDDFMKFISSGV